MSGSVVQRFQDHDLWSSLEQVDKSLSDIGDSLDGEDPEAIAHYRSLSLLVEYTRQRLNSSNPELASTSLLDPISQAINQINRFLNPPGQQRNRQKPLQERLSDAWSNSNSLLIAVSNLPTFETHEDVEALSAAIQKYHETIESSLSTMQTRIGDLETDLEKVSEQREQLSAEINEQKGLLANAIQEFTNSADEAQQKRDEDLDKVILALEKAQQDLEKKAEEQRQDFESAFNKKITEFETAISERTGKLDNEVSDRNQETENLLSEIREQLDEAKNLVALTGNVSMRGHYQQDAREQAKIADRWESHTIKAGIAAAISAVLIAVVEITLIDGFAWSGMILRYSITLTLVALAGYMIAQSRHHRKREADYSAVALELANIDPFLNSLPPQERIEIKKKLSYRYFNGHERNSITGDRPTDDEES